MIKVLHVVGGSSKNGAFKGAYILHKALLDLNIDSKVINDLDKNTSQNLESQNFEKNLAIINSSQKKTKSLIWKIKRLIFFKFFL